MESSQGTNTNTILIVIAIIILVALGVWWFAARGGVPAGGTDNSSGLDLEVNLPGGSNTGGPEGTGGTGGTQ